MVLDTGVKASGTTSTQTAQLSTGYWTRRGQRLSDDLDQDGVALVMVLDTVTDTSTATSPSDSRTCRTAGPLPSASRRES